MKEYFLGVVKDYPNKVRFDDSLTLRIECSAKEADKAADDYERKLNGGQTYQEAFAVARESAENLQSFSNREWFKVHCQTWAQSRDYMNFSKWTELPVASLPVN